ncbi:MAG: formylglycine-generating enzyme family protein [Gammaproteobacteria bacterium]
MAGKLLFVALLPAVLIADASDLFRQTPFRDFTRAGSVCRFCPDMITLPAGTFLMGAGSSEGHNDERGPDGQPVHVSIPEGISISVTEITRRQFAAFATARGRPFSAAGCHGIVDGQFRRSVGENWRDPGFPQSEDHPVVCVTWSMAKGYAEWLSQLTGQRYRLPTEAEWEYAARSGSAHRFWWGDAMLPDHVNCLHEWCDEQYRYTAPTRSYRSNRFGLYEMPGNVWEWTEDCYRADAYRHHRDYPAPVTGDPLCKRVIRGGSWAENYWSLRSSNREAWKPETPLNDIGFRVVRIGGPLPL